VLERHGRLDVGAELRDKLLTVSAATMDRLTHGKTLGNSGNNQPEQEDG
jgi:hypothetical protein